MDVYKHAKPSSRKDSGLVVVFRDYSELKKKDKVKPEDLDDDEWHEIMQHPEIGYRILSSVNGFSEIADFVLQHQEKWDGTGYPKSLKGEDITVQARIIGVAAAYDAMISERLYGDTLTEDEAVQEIKEHAGSQFDSYIAKAFVEKVLKKPW